MKKSLNQLLTRTDSYNTSNNVDDEMHTYVPCNKQCDSCTNFVVAKSSFECYATKRVHKVRGSTSCVSKHIIYIEFSLNCLKQGVGSTVDRKPRLWNYKSHIKTDVSSDTDDRSTKIRFIIMDQLNNTNSSSRDAIDNLLLQKEQFWISTLATIHKGLNSTYDWNRKRLTERSKQR